MRRRIRRIWPSAAILSCLAGACLSTALAGELAISSSDGVTTVRCDGQLVLEYQHRANPMKVYISKWSTPQGVQVLRDSPADHVHHRALMFALGIDDCDFWSEVPPESYGKQQPTGIMSAASSSSNGPSRAVIMQTIDWVNPRGRVLAVESRKITAYPDRLASASLLTWSTTLTPGTDQSEARLWGRHYFGLGMRFVESMDQGASFITPGHETGTAVRGSERLTRAAWCAIHGNADGKPVTIAVFDAPGNPRHPATWFTMNDPFAYLSATLDLDTEAGLSKREMTISRNAPLQVTYGLAAWDGHVDQAAIEQAYQTWQGICREE